MGWNHWNAFGPSVTEDDIRAAADLLVETGLRAAGYEFVVVDDCWMAAELTADGKLQPHPEDFPSGIGALAEYVHDRGLQFGIYSSAGDTTCQEYPASLGHERTHAEQFAEWGVDYLKYDNCGDHRGKDAVSRYEAMGRALQAVDRDIVYSICEWGHNDPWQWGRNVGGQLWRSGGDIVVRWTTDHEEPGQGVLDIIDETADRGVAGYQAPGGWNDQDMLEIGNGPGSEHCDIAGLEVDRPLTAAEERTHFSFWCLFGSPLMIGTDLADIEAETLSLLTNEEVIAVDQDPLGRQGTRDRQYGDREVWSKRLTDGAAAVILFNRGETERTVSTHVDEVDVASDADRYHVHDLWSGEEWETGDEIVDDVSPHGVTMVRVTPQ
jgi:alpha-galactosidase